MFRCCIIMYVSAITSRSISRSMALYIAKASVSEVVELTRVVVLRHFWQIVQRLTSHAMLATLPGVNSISLPVLRRIIPWRVCPDLSPQCHSAGAIGASAYASVSQLRTCMHEQNP